MNFTFRKFDIHAFPGIMNALNSHEHVKSSSERETDTAITTLASKVLSVKSSEAVVGLQREITPLSSAFGFYS